MIDNLALLVAHSMMAFFLWKLIKHENQAMKKERPNPLDRHRHKPKKS